MFSTPLICCSSGVATVRATVSADAPGSDVVTLTVGGTISGYWATGRIASAPKPIVVTKMLSTVAKRGRSMKKCVRRMSWTRVLALLFARGGVTDRAALWRDFCSRRRVRNAVDDYLIIRHQAGSNHAQAAVKIANLDLLGHNRAVGRDGHDKVLRLVRQHGRVRHQESLHWGADDQPHARELARGQETVG